MLDWLKSLFGIYDVFHKKGPEPRVIEHMGMKGYFSSEMISEFEKAGVDYEKMFRESVEESLAEGETDDDNPYA